MQMIDTGITCTSLGGWCIVKFYGILVMDMIHGILRGFATWGKHEGMLKLKIRWNRLRISVVRLWSIVWPKVNCRFFHVFFIFFPCNWYILSVMLTLQWSFPTFEIESWILKFSFNALKFEFPIIHVMYQINH